LGVVRRAPQAVCFEFVSTDQKSRTQGLEKGSVVNYAAFF
jgi:hypothetical protein